MAIVVSLAGCSVAAIGLLGVGAPGRLRGLLDRQRTLTAFPMTFGLRIAFGALFLLAAPYCRLPELVRVIGVLELTGAIALLAIGSRRLQVFVDWWLQRPTSFVRYWCVGALMVGAVIFYAGGWPS